MDANDPHKDREPQHRPSESGPQPRASSSEQWEDHGSPWWSPDPVAPSQRGRQRGGGRRSTSRAAAAQAGTPVTFTDDGGIYTGRSAGGRAWRITEVLTGWRLEFRDAGDGVATFAGIHHSVDAAIAEANR